MPRRTRVVLFVLFAIYLVLLVWLAVWKLHVPFVGRDDMRELKLVPFLPSGHFGASSPFDVVGNLAVFVPFGIYLRLLAPTWGWWKVGVAAAGLSLAFEVTQYVTAVGSSDLTDVIVNTAGGLAGFGLLALLGGAKRTTLLTWMLATATVLALVLVGVQVASFPQIPPGGVLIQ